MDSILSAALGYAVGRYTTPSANDATSDNLDLGTVSLETTVPYEQYVSLVTQLNDARVTMAGLILANQELNSTINSLDPNDASIPVYQLELERLRESYDLLYGFVEANYKEFTPDILYDGEIIEGLYINPNKVFDRDITDNNLYVDANDCIAIRGMTSKIVPVSFVGNVTGSGFFKSKFSPNEQTKNLSISTGWNGCALRVGSNIYGIHDFSSGRRLGSGDRYRPWIMVEFDKSIDLRDYIGTLAFATTNQWNNNVISSITNGYYADETIIIPYRKNVLLISPGFSHIPDTHYGIQTAPVCIWDSLKARELSVVSTAVFNLPIGAACHRGYPDNSNVYNLLGQAFCVPQADIT